MATSRACSPTSARMRSRISAAALLVNVTARICHGCTPLTPIRYATRWASTRVLPLARAGQDQQRALGRGDGARLLRVEARDDLVGQRLALGRGLYGSLIRFLRSRHVGCEPRDENQSAKCGASSPTVQRWWSVAAPLRLPVARGSGDSSGGSRSSPGGASGGGGRLKLLRSAASESSFTRPTVRGRRPCRSARLRSRPPPRMLRGLPSQGDPLCALRSWPGWPSRHVVRGPCTTVGPTCDTVHQHARDATVPGASALPSIALPCLPLFRFHRSRVFRPPNGSALRACHGGPTLRHLTPKPTKKPTPTPSPTPTPIAGDIEVAFQDTSIPDPFYNNTDYPITVYISALGTQDLPNVHVKLVAQNEGVSFKFDTGPIAFGGTYTHDVTVNLQAIGPSALILSASMVDGYTDTNKANNSKTVPIDVQLAP